MEITERREDPLQLLPSLPSDASATMRPIRNQPIGDGWRGKLGQLVLWLLLIAKVSMSIRLYLSDYILLSPFPPDFIPDLST